MSIRHVRVHRKYGFTLVELLVTVAIIGILASMATSIFSQYRRRANDSVAVNDLHNGIVAYQASKVDNIELSQIGVGSCIMTAKSTVLTNISNACSKLPGFQKSDGVWFTLNAVTGQMFTQHCKGTRTTDFGGAAPAYCTTFYSGLNGGGSINHLTATQFFGSTVVTADTQCNGP